MRVPAVDARNPPPVGSDWSIKMRAANGWAGQTETGFENSLGLGERGTERSTMSEEGGDAMPENSGEEGGTACM